MATGAHLQQRASYAEHPAMFRNNPLLFILFVALIPVFGLGLLLLGIWYLISIMDHISIDGGKVRYSHGLLSKDRTELDVPAIRSVRIRQTLFQRIFDTGDILIFTAGDTPEIVIKGVPHPHRAKELLS
jgi:uncharacterized membrane protein YdbT with pleckstrin-like domain